MKGKSQNNRKLLFFESHPIQYRAPIFQALERLWPGSFEVIYASDFSVRGYRDSEFQTSFSWDVPLLNGYPYRVLGNETGAGVEKWRGFSGKGVDQVVSELQPAAIMLHSLSYRYSWAAYIAALRRHIPIWLRVETQEEAVNRSFMKKIVRQIVYRSLYAGISKGFYIGELNKEHLLRFGVTEGNLVPALYCTADRLQDVPNELKTEIRNESRAAIGAKDENVVVGFFGKLIPKKDPLIIFDAIALLDEDLRRRVVCLVVGAGPLDQQMREMATSLYASAGVRTHFAGFVNQAAIDRHYLATDIVVLPSLRSGETWGLVINEALQAGCGAIMSDMVGCHRDFGNLDRVRVFRAGDAYGLAEALKSLCGFSRNFNWAKRTLETYSIEAAARAIGNQIALL